MASFKFSSKLLARAATLAIVSVLGTSCSSDFNRLDDPMVTGAVSKTDNQRNIIDKTSPKPQPYPGDVDPMVTAATGPRVTTSQKVAVAQPYPGDVITKKELDKPATTKSSSSTGKYTDRLPPTNVPVTTAKKTDIAKFTGGWTAIGGTTVSLLEGENLNNLSRRYGVPVKEIMRVNNISNSRNVVAGQKILIPTYVYTSKSAISAPDNDPETRAARSTTGYEGELTSGRIAIPTPRYHQVAKSAKPKSQVKTAKLSTKTSTKSGRTSAIVHTVVSGDTLGGLAVRYNTNRADIKKANGLKTDVVRLGQKLKIPSATLVATNQTKSSSNDSNVDPIVTGGTTSNTSKNRSSFENVGVPASYTKPEDSAAIARRAAETGPAPKQTGVSAFRWPVKGRIVSQFGSKQNGGPNDGIDIAVPIGTAIKAAENGKVIYSGSDLEQFGKLILVRHADGWVSAYAYSSKNLVVRGDIVRRGQTIAMSGRTGAAGIPKVHFELRKDSSPVNPLDHLARS